MNLIDLWLGNGISTTSSGYRYGINGVDTEIKNESLTVLYTCVKILADNFSRVPITVRAKDGSLIDHELSDLWNITGSGIMNPQTIRSTSEWDRNTHGNSFFEVTKNGLEYIPAGEVQDYYIEGGKLYYKIMPVQDVRNKDRKPSRIVSADMMLHFKGVATQGVMALSPITAAHGTHQLMANAINTVSNFYKNSAMSPYAIESGIPPGSTYTELRAERKSFKEANAGVDNAGEAIRLMFGEKITPLAVKFADNELIQTMEFSRDTLTSLYQIPNYMLSSNDTSQGIEEQTASFVSTTIAAIANVYKHELEYKQLTLEEKRAGVKVQFELDELMEVTFGGKITALSTAIDKGLITPNEASRRLGFEGVKGAFGDYHYVQMQNVPLEMYAEYQKGIVSTNDPMMKGLKDNNNTV